MGRPARTPAQAVDAVAEQAAERELRSLFLRSPFSGMGKERATAGRSTEETIDDSPWAVAMRPLRAEWSREIVRLEQAGVPVAERVRLLREWADDRLAGVAHLSRNDPVRGTPHGTPRASDHHKPEE